jgi:hypothetical protein
MIEKIEDLGLKDLDPKAEDYLTQIDNLLQEKMNISFAALKAPILSYIQSHAEELSIEFPNIAPKGDYSNMIEDNDGMTAYFKGLKEEDFKIAGIDEDEKFGLLKFIFICTAIDDGDGDSFEAFTYVTKAGKVKHSFAQYCG